MSFGLKFELKWSVFQLWILESTLISMVALKIWRPRIHILLFLTHSLGYDIFSSYLCTNCNAVLKTKEDFYLIPSHSYSALWCEIECDIFVAFFRPGPYREIYYCWATTTIHSIWCGDMNWRLNLFHSANEKWFILSVVAHFWNSLLSFNFRKCELTIYSISVYYQRTDRGR